MNRCLASLLPALAGTSLVLGLATAPVAAQVRTDIPASALKGSLIVKVPPVVLLDGQEARLAPGARIRNTQNLLVMSGALVNQELTVAYTRDPVGLLQDVWVLTADEQAVKRATAGSGRNFLFGAETGR